MRGKEVTLIIVLILVFSNRFVGRWNSLSEDCITSTMLNEFKP